MQKLRIYIDTLGLAVSSLTREVYGFEVSGPAVWREDGDAGHSRRRRGMKLLGMCMRVAFIVAPLLAVWGFATPY